VLSYIIPTQGSGLGKVLVKVAINKAEAVEIAKDRNQGKLTKTGECPASSKSYFF